MNVSLTPELENMVNEQISTGMYSSASEVVREALRVLFEQQEVRRLRLEGLKREIKIGADHIKKGKYKDYGSGAELMNDIRARGAARMKAKKEKRR